MNVDEIKQRYPKPMTADEGKCRVNTYCVGGAFCMALDDENGRSDTPSAFPPEVEVADAMEHANPELSPFVAQHYATMLVNANDRGDFEQAWWYLDMALNYTADRNLGI